MIIMVHGINGKFYILKYIFFLLIFFLLLNNIIEQGIIHPYLVEKSKLVINYYLTKKQQLIHGLN